MFGLFKGRSEKEKLEQKYKKLLEQSYVLSRSNRAASDKVMAEAEKVLKQIEVLD